MKKFSIGAAAVAGLVSLTAPAMAATHHHHAKHGKNAASMHQKSDEGSASTADLNARSLQQAQTPVSSGTAPMAAPMASPTAPTAAPMAPNAMAPNAPAPGAMPSSTMPANAPQPPQGQ
ncbi:hypothetical protein AA101099_3084 [Neoasaia chiangmaiensis NBRC 101099]|uniref:Uncharacterized protein n=1 Tax=Neoasaia chiangmaiensis TaxID=320497 RepID=A0A1U9KNG8_9PROT|nr:hypothetical protein [Neoasaia chiangmaiensis]AQS87335.1 hypothetical protein A0U93_04620 [Neoasaia chiangmaiensis]GBR43072.1 hypothetical protein AA101099_3084 [Neoasaia chiangmaiensis NBRC 101099]GEN16094.1 hypothetical protein NCH01_25250 [Neoasaia chiangmaiensis]